MLWKVDFSFPSRIDRVCSGSSVFRNRNGIHCLPHATPLPPILFASQKDPENALFFCIRYLLRKRKRLSKVFTFLFFFFSVPRNSRARIYRENSKLSFVLRFVIWVSSLEYTVYKPYRIKFPKSSGFRSRNSEFLRVYVNPCTG